eukprot:UN00706
MLLALRFTLYTSFASSIVLFYYSIFLPDMSRSVKRNPSPSSDIVKFERNGSTTPGFKTSFSTASVILNLLLLLK